MGVWEKFGKEETKKIHLSKHSGLLADVFSLMLN